MKMLLVAVFAILLGTMSGVALAQTADSSSGSSSSSAADSNSSVDNHPTLNQNTNAVSGSNSNSNASVNNHPQLNQNTDVRSGSKSNANVTNNNNPNFNQNTNVRTGDSRSNSRSNSNVVNNNNPTQNTNVKTGSSKSNSSANANNDLNLDQHQNQNQKQNTDVDSSSHVSTSSSLSNTNVFKTERPLFAPNSANIGPAGQLFINPGQDSAASTVQYLYWSFQQFCGGRPVSRTVMNSARYQKVVQKGQSGIDVVFVPAMGYVAGTPQGLDVPVEYTTVDSNLPPLHKYYCVGTLYLVTQSKKDVARLTNVPVLKRRAREFVMTHLSGFSNVILVTGPKAVAFQNEVRTSGHGFAVAPQGSSFIGSIFAGLFANFSHGGTKSGVLPVPIAAVLLFAEAPRGNCNAVLQLKENPHLAEAKTGDHAQHVVITIQTPNQ